jgi:hypothetical protein
MVSGWEWREKEGAPRGLTLIKRWTLVYQNRPTQQNAQSWGENRKNRTHLSPEYMAQKMGKKHIMKLSKKKQQHKKNLHTKTHSTHA